MPGDSEQEGCNWEKAVLRSLGTGLTQKTGWGHTGSPRRGGQLAGRGQVHAVHDKVLPAFFTTYPSQEFIGLGCKKKATN